VTDALDKMGSLKQRPNVSEVDAKRKYKKVKVGQGGGSDCDLQNIWAVYPFVSTQDWSDACTNDDDQTPAYHIREIVYNLAPYELAIYVLQ